MLDGRPKLAELAWRNVKRTPPPDDCWPMAIVATVICECGEVPVGARVVLSAARVQGDWIFDFGHLVEVTDWMPLPALSPQPGKVN